MSDDIRPPRDNLVRGMPGGYAVSAEEGRELTGRIANANEWAEIQSTYEGHFMERFAPGAFTKTFAESADKIRILFQHGRDPELGQRPIAALRELGEDDLGAHYRAELLEGLPTMVVDGLRKGQYGSSHTFSVVREDWEKRPKAGAHNPGALPERTVREAKVREISVVTWPAYMGATAGVRSMTDEYILDSLTADPTRLRELVDYIEPAATAPSADAGAQPHLEPERREAPVVSPPKAAPKPRAAAHAAPPVPKERHTMSNFSREEMASRVTELMAIIERSATEFPGVMPDEAQARYDADNAELDALQRDIAAWDSRQARLATFAKTPEMVERGYEPIASFSRKTTADIYDLNAIDRGSSEERSQKLRDNAMRAVETSHYAHPSADQDRTRASIANLLDNGDTRDKELARRILVTGSPVYRRMFGKYVTGQPMSPEESRVGTLLVQTDNQGGYAVPFAFDPTLVHIGAHTSFNPIRQYATVKQIVGTDTFNGVTAAAATVARADEIAAATEGGMAFGQILAITSRVQAMITVSREMMEDRSDLVAEMASLIAEAKDTEEENIFTNGTGAALGTTFQPTGLLAVHTVTASCWTHRTTDVAATLDADDLFKTEAAVPLRYRANAMWFMGRATLRAIQALEGTNGQLFGGVNYSAVGNPAVNTGNTGLKLLGYPVVECPSATTGVANTTIVLGLGDPKSYYIIDRVGMSIEVIPNLWAAAQMPTGQRGILGWWRNTGKVANVDAGRRLEIT